MSKSSKIKIIIMLVLTPVFLYLIYGTNLISPRADYVRLKDGTVMRDVPFSEISNTEYRIDGKVYTQFDVDSLAW